MNDPAQIRKYVRTVMAFGPPLRQWSEVKLFEGVKRLARDPLHVDELQAALRWNEGQGYIEATPDTDAQLPGEEAPLLWTMTPAGRNKEGLK